MMLDQTMTMNQVGGPEGGRRLVGVVPGFAIEHVQHKTQTVLVQIHMIILFWSILLKGTQLWFKEADPEYKKGHKKTNRAIPGSGPGSYHEDESLGHCKHPRSNQCHADSDNHEGRHGSMFDKLRSKILPCQVGQASPCNQRSCLQILELGDHGASESGQPHLEMKLWLVMAVSSPSPQV